MRLSLHEIESIVKCKNQIFGKKARIYLFGSRIDESKKGGDIDLYLNPLDGNEIGTKKIEFLTLIQKMIGEQKIDIVFAKDANRIIEIEAKKRGVELDLEKIKLEKYFGQCNKHLQRIEEAYEDIKDIIPMTTEKYENLEKNKVQAIDQYLFRFSKLQDTMGDKIFKLIVWRYEQNNNNIPFLDILNKLEKYGFLNNGKEWIHLRNLRNDIAHQYDDEPEEMANSLNDILSRKNIIKDIYLKLKNKYEEDQ